MNRIIISGLIVFGWIFTGSIGAQEDNALPIKGFCIAAPRPDRVDDFVKFIDKELVAADVAVMTKLYCLPER